MSRLAAFLLAVSLSACATTPEPSAPSRARALAALLVETEAANPARLAAAEAEMAALERALTRTPEAELAPEAAPPVPPQPASAPLAAPDLSGARSVLSAVHVASYRERRHAETGWAQLTARHAPLSGLQARLSRADLGERGVFLRLKAGPFDTPAAAEAACDAIKASGEWCSVTDFSGEGL